MKLKMAPPVPKPGTRPPWVGLAAAVWVQFGSGNTYSFPLFSSTLKSVMGLSQQPVTILGVAVDIGESAGILPGIVCNKFPPWVVLSIGASACFGGYGLIWLSATQTLQNLPYWLLCFSDFFLRLIWLALLTASNSSAWFSTTILVTNMRNFPLSRGTVAGLLKGYSGLSARIYTVIYSMILNESASALLLFLTFGLPIICGSMMYLIRLCAPATAQVSASNNFLFAQVASILLGVYLLGTKIIDTKFSLAKPVCYTVIAVMVVFMMAPLAFLFSGLLAGYVYDTEAAIQGVTTCMGASCFRLTFLILAGLCGLGAMLGVLPTVRIRPVYQMLYSGGSFSQQKTSSGH